MLLSLAYIFYYLLLYYPFGGIATLFCRRGRSFCLFAGKKIPPTDVGGIGFADGVWDYTTPCASIASATFRKPAMLAPATRSPSMPYFFAASKEFL